MTRLSKLKIISLLIFMATNKTASAEESEFINAIKNLNLQNLDTYEISESASAQPVNIENKEKIAKDSLEQKNKKLQLKYEKLLGSYNEIKLKGESASTESQKSIISTLTAEKNKLYSDNSELRKQLAEATRQLSALRKQGELSVAGQKEALSALEQENTRLTSESGAARKQLAEATAQLIALRKQNELSVADQKKALSALEQENTRLTSESGAARKQLAEATAQLIALRKQNELSVADQKKALSALEQENTRLTSESESARKQLDETTARLTKLQQSQEQAAVSNKNLLKTAKGQNSYSLGVFYYDKINAEFEKITKNNIELIPSLMIAGVNDAFNKSLQMKKNQIMENVVKIDRMVQSINTDYAKKILKTINKKKYEVLTNGSFLVTDKATAKKYSDNETITFDMLEKTLAGKPILNTMNTKVKTNSIHDPLLKKIVSEGGKGGIMTLYGRADILYKNIPDGISPESLIAITFMLK